MKRLILLFSIFILGTLSVSAQTDLPDKCQAFYPEVLSKARILTEQKANALMKSSDFGQNKVPRDPGFWVVYSDRSNNTTYTSPGGGTPFSKLDFNEKVRIAKIQNGWALVYTEPMEDIPYPLISQYAMKKSKGWVSMKKLLLWHSAIANSSEIYYKALLCVNLDEGNQSLSAGKKYYNPNDKSDYARIDNTMDFRFVMKREGDLVLLSSVHSMDKAINENVLEGWYPKNSYVEWNQRSCIEPTWNIKDVEYFADEQRTANVYSTTKLDEAVYRVSFKRKPQPAKYDKFLYRQDPGMLRFPILDESTTELYNCSTFGSADGSVAQTEAIAQEGGSASMYKAEVLQDMTNINIGLVIDGTKSMEEFYPAVSNAIKESIAHFDKNKYKVKVGVVIYRDYGDGEFVTEKIKLTNPQNQNLYDFLMTGGKYGIKSGSADRTLEEALYCGIDTAIDQLGFSADQSNILLVVGDCGNDTSDTKFKRSDIINKLVSKNINIIGFQVRYDNDDAFSLFNDQIGAILNESLQKRYLSLINNTRVQNKSTDAAKVNIVETKDGYKLINKDGNIYVGSLNYPYQGQTMQTAKLKTLIVESIDYLKESVLKQIDLIQLNYAQSFKSGEGFSTIEEAFVRSKLGDAGFEAVKKAGSLMAFKGYARKQDKSGRDFFKTIVFLSSDELNSLISRLSGVYNASQQLLNDKYADRAPYIDAMKALVKIMIPEDMTDERMSQMTYDEIMQKVAGLNESADALKGYTLSQLASPEIVPYEEFTKLISDFNRKYKNLSKLKTQPYKYTYPQNGIKYYWLPVEDLP